MNCSTRLQRWALRMSQFSYLFEYIKGEDNVNSDCSSGLPLNETVNIEEPYKLMFVVKSLNFDEMPVTIADIKKYTDADKTLCLLKQYIQLGFPVNMDSNLTQFKHVASDLSIMKGCIMYGKLMAENTDSFS